MEKETAMKILKELHDKSLFAERTALETIIPELKKSENEKIREELLDFLENVFYLGKNAHFDRWEKSDCSKWIAWLEKQGKTVGWKPSKEQMDVLYGLAYITNQYDEHKESIITRLYQDLKREFFNSSSYENMFPTNTNAEDDVRRRSTIQVLEYARSLDTYNQYGKADIDKNIAWLEKQCYTKKDVDDAYLKGISDAKNELEKQGEQKPVIDFKAKNWYVSKVDGRIHDMTYNPTDKVEPKFKIGDYIVNDYCAGKVVALTDDAYLLDTEQGIPFSCEHNVHLWTIQDAKDGDVLVDEDNNIGIFQECEGMCWNSYIYLGCDGRLRGFSIGGKHEQTGTHPATKEQRDLLFKGLKEAGYEWNDSTKELKKINSYCQENCKGYQETGKCFADGGCDAKRKAEQEPVEDLMPKEKPANKIEPKFHEGEWVVNNSSGGVYQVTEIRDDEYCLWPLYAEIQGYFRIIDVDTDYHLWIIQDAKDGDVLACGDKVTDCPFIFHNLTEELNPRSYCGVSMSQHFQDNDENGGFWCHSDEVRPATKEQRELLFKKMNEAGYEWDAEKKELKLLITNGGDFEQKQEWSEEDENYLQSAENACEYQYGKNTSTILWLKSLKERVQSQYLTITNEELVQAKKEAYNDALDKIEYHSDTPTFNDGWSAAIWYLKKRTTQPQSTWKPNKEQIHAFEQVYE